MTDDSLVKTVLIVIAALLLLPFLMMAIAMPMMGLWGWGHMGTGTGTGFMWLVMSIVPIVILVAGGYLLYRVLSGPEGPTRDPAIEELRTAYARGDLSDEEFERRRERLRGDQ